MLDYLDGTPTPDLRRQGRGDLARRAQAAGGRRPASRARVLAFLEERMLANNPTGLVTMASHLLKAEDKTAELAARGIPTFVLYGEDDNAWPPAQQRDMAARLGAERTCIPGAAHNPNVEAPATTAHALTRFWTTRKRMAQRCKAALFGPPEGPTERGVTPQATSAEPVTAQRARPKDGRDTAAACLPGSAAGSRTSRSPGPVRGGNTSSYLLPWPAARASARRRRRTPSAMSSARRRCRCSDSGVCSQREHLPGRQVVQLDPAAVAAQHPRGGERVERQRERAAGVVDGQQVAAGLVVHHDEFGAARRPARPGVEPVDPPGHRDQVGPRRHRALHADRLVGRVEPGDVPLDQWPGPVPVARPTARRSA